MSDGGRESAGGRKSPFQTPEAPESYIQKGLSGLPYSMFGKPERPFSMSLRGKTEGRNGSFHPHIGATYLIHRYLAEIHKNRLYATGNAPERHGANLARQTMNIFMQVHATVCINMQTA